MRALFVIHNPAFGGGYNAILQQRRGLEAAGWEIAVVTCDEPSTGAQRLREAGVDVVTMPLHRVRASPEPAVHAQLLRGFFPEVRALRRLIGERSIDVVQPHGETNVHGAVAGRLERVGVSWYLNDTAAPALVRRALVPAVSGLSDTVTVTGYGTLSAYPGLERLGDRVIVTFPYVDPGRFRPDPRQRHAARQELAVPEGALAVGAVGTRNPRKGHDLLIEAACELLPHWPAVHLLIMGGLSPAHREYEESLQAAVRRSGLGERLRILDPGGRVPELLPGLDLFVMPSHPGEGMPTVILEAMACELAVIATDIAATREAVDDGVTGLVVPPRDRPALVTALQRMLGDGDLRNRMGTAGRRRMLAQFGPERAIDNRLRAWDMAVGSARCRPARWAR